MEGWVGVSTTSVDNFPKVITRYSGPMQWNSELEPATSESESSQRPYHYAAEPPTQCMAQF